ncbi:MAG: response regulator transcription factor [Hyphomonadaceae bacterium]|nr:response regulator transcription factor [Hyphomonadaceae bacterium]
MSPKTRAIQFLVCDENAYTRKLVADVLAGAGFEKVQIANDGVELLTLTAEFQPRIVITSSRIPAISGLDFTRMIRAGYGVVNRATSIIVMTDTPTQKFLDASREAGVDEMLVRPFNGAALLSRVEACLLRPRRFVESVAYVGPCRRRRMLEDYGGPMRRFTDPLEEHDKPLWEAESNRALVRRCLTRISELAADLTPNDRRKLREVYAAVKDTEQLADDVRDQFMGDAARSLSRYISAIGGSGAVDQEVLTTHIDAMQKLCVLGAEHQDAREELVRGLVKVVDKRLGRAAPKPGGAPPTRAA